MPPLEIEGVAGYESPAVCIECLFFGTFELEMQHVQSVVDVGPQAYMFCHVALSHARRREDAR